MRKFIIFTALATTFLVFWSCSAKQNPEVTRSFTPDPGLNINIAPMYPLQTEDEDTTHTYPHRVQQDSWFQASSDSASYWADMYMSDFIDWEERVGMKQMLDWKWYPAWYGGFYIDNGKMVFLLTSEEGVKTLPEGAIWKKCKYSHNDLVAIQKKVTIGIDKYLDIFKSVGSTIDDRANCVVVYIRNNSPEALKLFKEKIYVGDSVIIR